LNRPRRSRRKNRRHQPKTASPWEPEWQRVDAGNSLGEGGQGTVYLVQKESREVGVLKVLNNQHNPRARVRMQREATALDSLTTRGVKGVPKLKASNTNKWKEPDEILFIVMEHIEGITLQEAVRQRGPLSLQESLLLTETLFGIIGDCHSEELLHRDVKPSNIVLRGGALSSPYLIDFGLSFNREENEQSALTKTDEKIGNRFLELPEHKRASGNKHDARSDLTMIMGILLYALTGIEPQVLLDEQSRSPHQRVLEQLRAGVPDHALLPLMRLFDRSFQVPIDRRFQSVEACLEGIASVRESLASSEQAQTIEDAMKLFDASDDIAHLVSERSLLERAGQTVYEAHRSVHSSVLARRSGGISDSGGAPGGLRFKFELGYFCKVGPGSHLVSRFLIELTGTEMVVCAAVGDLPEKTIWRSPIADPSFDDLKARTVTHFEELAKRVLLIASGRALRHEN
jgi:serine/threonine protein kinase